MRELISVVLMLVHLTATVVWMGGIAFILLVAIPSARQVLGGDAGRLIGEVGRRFTPMANISIVLLLLTGPILLAINGSMPVEALQGGNVAMVIKALLFLLMTGVHFFRGKVLAPRIAGTQSDGEKARLQKLSLNLVWLNLGVGLAVLFLSAFVGAR